MERHKRHYIQLLKTPMDLRNSQWLILAFSSLEFEFGGWRLEFGRGRLGIFSVRERPDTSTPGGADPSATDSKS
jgi:hypothetical protein